MANFVWAYSKVCRMGALVLALFCLMTASCDLPQGLEDEKATLTITLPGAAAAGRAVHIPEPISAAMDYTLDFYKGAASFSIGPTSERVVTVDLEPGYWDITVIARYGSAETAMDKKAQVEIRAGQANSVSFTMDADYYIVPNIVTTTGLVTTTTSSPPTSLLITMNTSTPFSSISGWTDSFSLQWYSPTGTPLGLSSSFGPGNRSMSYSVSTPTAGTFNYFVEVANTYTYTPPGGGATTTGTARSRREVATVMVTGGMAYSIGDTGPGGGIIFYVSGPGFMSNGVLCHYLEAAPTDLPLPLVQWGKSGTSVVTGMGIGAGYTNTQNIITVLASGIPETGRAAQNARAYTGGGLTDWFLPSRGELQALYATTIPGLSLSIWSSTEDTATHAWSVGNAGPPGFWSDAKTTTLGVRPVRAF